MFIGFPLDIQLIPASISKDHPLINFFTICSCDAVENLNMRCSLFAECLFGDLDIASGRSGIIAQWLCFMSLFHESVSFRTCGLFSHKAPKRDLLWFGSSPKTKTRPWTFHWRESFKLLSVYKEPSKVLQWLPMVFAYCKKLSCWNPRTIKRLVFSWKRQTGNRQAIFFSYFSLSLFKTQNSSFDRSSSSCESLFGLLSVFFRSPFSLLLASS